MSGSPDGVCPHWSRKSFFHKAKERRPYDELDFLARLPHLTAKQRHWLREATSLVHPEQPWLPQLS